MMIEKERKREREKREEYENAGSVTEMEKGNQIPDTKTN